MTHTFPANVRRKWLAIFGLLVWIFTISGIFYVTQKPLAPQDIPLLLTKPARDFSFSLAALGRTTLDIGVALWLWGMIIGLGYYPYRWLMAPIKRTTGNSPDETVIFSAGLGVGLVGLTVLGLGLLGWLSTVSLYGLALTFSLLAFPAWLKAINHRKILTMKKFPSFKMLKMPRLLWLYLTLTVGLAFSIALLPPTDWDGLFYHLTGPKLHLTAGQIQAGFDLPHLNFPGLFEMIFMLAMAIRNDVVAKLMHFGFSLLLAALVWLIAKEQLSLKQPWLALIFLFSMPMVLTLGGWAYNDLALAFYQVAALYALLQWHTQQQTEDTPSTRWLVLAGLCCGLTMSLKYTSVVPAVTLGFLLLWWHARAKMSLSHTLKNALTFGLPALLIATPWYLKNWFFTGNPVYPFVFGGTFWDEFRAVAYAGANTGIGFNLLDLLTLPIYLTIGLGDANYHDGRTGPLFLAFLPLILAYGLFRYRREATPKALYILLFFALAHYIFWTYGVIWSAGLRQSRLLLPAFVALCPVLAWMMDDVRHLNQRAFSLHRFLMLYLVVVLSLGLFDQFFNNQLQGRYGWLHYRPWHYLIQDETEAEYLTRRLGAYYVAMAEINTQLPPEAMVTFLWEPRTYHCQRPCLPDSILDKYGHLQYLHGQDATAIRNAWREAGITHVLIFRRGLQFLLEEETLPDNVRPDITVLNDLEADYFEEVFDVVGWYQVYTLK